MKNKTVLFLIVFFIFANTLKGYATITNFTGNIATNLTLNVPDDFADIQTALAYLKDKRINTDVIVIIQVADGSYDYTSTIEIKHPDGDKIQILGNTTVAENCTINFSSCDAGLLVANGNKLGLLNGFNLYGGNSVPYGIVVKDASFLQSGPKIVVNNFSSSGIYVSSHSYINACYITSSYNGIGFQIQMNSTAMVEHATASNNSSYGFFVQYDSFAYAKYATASNNTTYDFYAEVGSFIGAGNANSTTNRYSPTRGTLGNSRSWIYSN